MGYSGGFARELPYCCCISGVHAVDGRCNDSATSQDLVSANEMAAAVRFSGWLGQHLGDDGQARTSNRQKRQAAATGSKKLMDIDLGRLKERGRCDSAGSYKRPASEQRHNHPSIFGENHSDPDEDGSETLESLSSPANHVSHSSLLFSQQRPRLGAYSSPG